MSKSACMHVYSFSACMHVYSFIHSKQLFSEGHKLIHLNLSIALFVGYLIFGVGIELAASNEVSV